MNKLPILMNKLPLEIQNEIWNFYWMDIFKKKCIDLLKNEKYKINHLDYFVRKHVYPTQSEIYLKQIKYYLIKYNTYLKQIKDNKGLILFFKSFIKNFDNIYSSDYLNDTYEKINDDLKYITMYCVLCGIPYTHNHTLSKFKSISNN